MKRRDFIASIGAASTVSLVPNAAIARANLPSAMIARAEHMASLWVHSSAKMFQNTFGLDDTTAAQLFADLTQRGIVGQANHFGVARATIPCFENPAFLAKRAVIKRTVIKRTVIKTKLRPAPKPDAHDMIEDVKTLVKTLDETEAPDEQT